MTTELERVRKTVSRQVDCVLDGLSFQDGVHWLLNHASEFGEDAKFEIDYDYSSSRLLVIWTELESDKEYEHRLDMIRKAKNARRKQYEELKKEFESKE